MKKIVSIDLKNENEKYYMGNTLFRIEQIVEHPNIDNGHPTLYTYYAVSQGKRLLKKVEDEYKDVETDRFFLPKETIPLLYFSKTPYNFRYNTQFCIHSIYVCNIRHIFSTINQPLNEDEVKEYIKKFNKNNGYEKEKLLILFPNDYQKKLESLDTNTTYKNINSQNFEYCFHTNQEENELEYLCFHNPNSNCKLLTKRFIK